MEKYYYITYGVFTPNIEEFVFLLEQALNIKLSDFEPEEGEIYHYWKESENSVVRSMSICYGNPIGYYYSENEILYPSYLILCTLFSQEEANVKKYRNIIENLPKVKKLDVIIQGYDE